jgi:hypothetical protein
MRYDGLVYTPASHSALRAQLAYSFPRRSGVRSLGLLGSLDGTLGIENGNCREMSLCR